MGNVDKRLTVELSLDFDEWQALSHALTEGASFLAQDAEMWNDIRPERADFDRKAEAIAYRVNGEIDSVCATFFTDEIKAQFDRNKAAWDARIAEMRKRIDEQEEQQTCTTKQDCDGSTSAP